MPIRVSIVEDADHVRESLGVLISGSPGFTCVSSSRSAEEAFEKIPREQIDVVLMDVNLPFATGIECVAWLRAKGVEVPVLMLTVCDNDEVIFQALKAGACGYLLKQTPAAEILAAIKEVHEGGAPMSSIIARKVVQSFHQLIVPEQDAVQLTKRESHVLELLGKGYHYKEIGEELGISRATVATLLRRAYEALHVRSRIEALAKLPRPKHGGKR